MCKKVSIVVITYNARDDLKECIESLEKQTYREKEIIIVDDASTDGTLAFLERYQSETSLKMTVISNQRNLGVAGARNVGIQNANGEIIAFTDSDVVADSDWVSELIKGYDMEGVVAVGGSVLPARITNIWELSLKGYDFVSSKEGYVSYILGCNMSFREGVLRRYMFNDEIKYGYEEWLLCDYLVNNMGKIYYRPQAIVHHKNKSTMFGLLRRKYKLGLSSIWYRKKQKKLFMFKRHIILLFALTLIPFSQINYSFLMASLALFFMFAFSLVRDEIIFRSKTTKEIVITLPFVIFIEFFHFLGSIRGLVKFRLFKKYSM